MHQPLIQSRSLVDEGSWLRTMWVQIAFRDSEVKVLSPNLVDRNKRATYNPA